MDRCAKTASRGVLLNLDRGLGFPWPRLSDAATSLKYRESALDETVKVRRSGKNLFIFCFLRGSVPPWCKGLVFGCGFVALGFKVLFLVSIGHQSQRSQTINALNTTNRPGNTQRAVLSRRADRRSWPFSKNDSEHVDSTIARKMKANAS